MKPAFSEISTDLLCLQVTHMPRSPDQVIFVLTDRQINGRTKPIALPKAILNVFKVRVDYIAQVAVGVW
jgi:hypothetical protein